MKLSHLVLLCAFTAPVYAAENAENSEATFKIEDVSIELLKDHPELAGQCSQVWYDTMGHKNYPEYEKIKDAHTKFIAEHANDETFPIMLVALLNRENEKEVVGMGALRATCYPRTGEVLWADEHPECTPWAAGGCVTEAYQNKGIGKKIALKLAHLAVSLKHSKVYLLAEDETNQKFYEREGVVKLADVVREDKKNNRQVPGIVYKVDLLALGKHTVAQEMQLPTIK